MHCQKTATLNYTLLHIGILQVKCWEQFLKLRLITATSEFYVGIGLLVVRATRASVEAILLQSWSEVVKVARITSLYT